MLWREITIPIDKLTRFHYSRWVCNRVMHFQLAGNVSHFLELILAQLNPAQRSLMDSCLEKFRAPTQIGKLSEKIESTPLWKCKDFENFALYLSIPVLTKVVDDSSILHHWGLLVDSLHTGLKDIHIDKINDSDQKMHEFVRNIDEIHSFKDFTYIAHQSLHFMDNVYNWGPAWAQSAFPFGTWNRLIANCVHSEEGIILQILRCINLVRFDQILKEMMGPDGDDVVNSYCQNLKRNPECKLLSE
ncbi:hypothetical protein QAD02_012940 [Eretmocerus hayati]|uniref:Uncharacterized protein n=1 Tax=Eretmocerus hayati TaxID=131215 RepID=A0ACC2P114_9HYME|nr:hypothetical protein QAD02_012940 [Eretmocerus hayati]